MSLSLLIFIILYLGGILLTVFSDIAWGVALYELLYFIFPSNRWWYTLPDFRYTFFLAIIFSIVFLLKRRSYVHSGVKISFPQEKWLMVMIGIMGIISFYAVYPQEHYRFFRYQIQQLIFLYIAFRVIDKEEKFELVVWSFLAGCFYVGYIAHSMPRDIFGRLEGIGMPDGPDANTTASVLITAIPLLVHYLITGKKWQRAVGLLFFPFIANAIILLNSRGAFLALVIATGHQMFSMLRKKVFSGRQRLVTISVLVISIGLFFYLADKTFWNRMVSLEGVEVGKGTATRVNFWIAAIELAREHPFGLGARGFEFLSPSILPEEWLTAKGTITVHSTYFQALVDFGYVGIIIVGGFIVSTFLQLRKIKILTTRDSDVKNYSIALAFEAAFLAFLIAGIFIDRLYSEVLYWLMLFVAVLTKTYLASLEQDPSMAEVKEGQSL